MAINRKYAEGNVTSKLIKAFAQTASRTTNQPVTGDPVRIGNQPGVSSSGVDSNARSVIFLDGVFELLVGGVDNSGSAGSDANVAVKGGDQLYFAEGDTPPVSKRADGVPFGIAWGDHDVELVASGGLTTKIEVRLTKGK